MEKFKHIINLTVLILLYFVISSGNIVRAEMMDFSELTERLMPSVVNISTTQKKATKDYVKLSPFGMFSDEMQEYLDKFGMLPPSIDDDNFPRKQAVSLGSGFIIDKDGHIVTNYHVISDSEEVTVTLSNEEEYKATIIGFDQKTDLALLKINSKKDLPFVKFGDSDESKVGQWIIAIGNPFGFGGSVTTGIISAKSRDIGINSSIVNNFIQTDAAINKGNSGGPMFNLKGEVIGVNTAIFSPSGNNIGIGFATPSSVARDIIEQLKLRGKIERGWLGVKIQKITPDIAESLGFENANGALVAEVMKNSPSDKAGIKIGDIIIKFDGRDVVDTNNLSRMAASTAIGKNVNVTIIRSSKEMNLKIKIGKLPEDVEDRESNATKNTDHNSPSAEFFGVVLQELNDNLRSNLGLSSDVKGLVVTNIKEKSLWLDSKNPLRRGDVIASVNNVEISSINEFKEQMKKSQKEKVKFLLAFVYRGGQTLFVPLKIS